MAPQMTTSVLEKLKKPLATGKAKMAANNSWHSSRQAFAGTPTARPVQRPAKSFWTSVLGKAKLKQTYSWHNSRQAFYVYAEAADPSVEAVEVINTGGVTSFFFSFFFKLMNTLLPYYRKKNAPRYNSTSSAPIAPISSRLPPPADKLAAHHHREEAEPLVKLLA